MHSAVWLPLNASTYLVVAACSGTRDGFFAHVPFVETLKKSLFLLICGAQRRTLRPNPQVRPAILLARVSPAKVSVNV